MPRSWRPYRVAMSACRLPRVLLAASAATLLSACGMKESDPLLFIAHRGASAEAPENTLASFELAWKQGADGVEGDFFLTADGEMVCIHDSTTLRTGGRELVVADSTLAQLRELEYGAWKGPGWAGQPLPTLLEVLRTVPRRGRIYIELKCGAEGLAAVRSAIGRSGLRAWQVVIISFDEQTVLEAKRMLPAHRAYWLTGLKLEDGSWSPSTAEILATLDRCGADGLDAQAKPEAITPELRDGLIQRRLDLAFWTVNDAATAARLGELGAASLTTDRPGALRAELGR